MMVSEGKKVDFNSENWQTRFFMYKFVDVTSRKNVLLNLPDNMCFSFGLKEIISICEVTEEINNRSYFYLADSFYNFLKTDQIFKNIDYFYYINLLKQLKDIKENIDKINIITVKKYMEKTYKIYYKKYILELQNELNDILDGREVSQNEANFISDIFINELLSMGYTYKYLNFIFNYYFYKNSESAIFSGLKELIDFLLNKSSDSFDMYLPIKNTSERDIIFVKNQFSGQEIVKGDELIDNKYGFELNKEKYYCHVYFNANDYYKCTEDQLNRVNSIFNILKFYTNSQISFDFDSKPYIFSKKMGIINVSSIKYMLQYSYFQGTTNIIETVNETFDNLSKKSNNILIDIYDIMNYSQKDHDIFSNDQFLSKWISLESCASKNERKKGFEGVIEYVPKTLTITFYRQKITRILKNSISDYTLEDFILNFDSNSLNNKISKIKNIYYQYEINKYIEIFSENSKLYNSINDYQEKIKYMLYRIYIMRNKYVHSGNTINNNDMLRYYLNIIEPFFVDKVIKTLNLLVLNEIFEYSKISWKDIYGEIDFKYDSLFNTLSLVKGPLKLSKDKFIKLDDILDKEKRKNLIINILVERTRNMETLKKQDEQYSADGGNDIVLED